MLICVKKPLRGLPGLNADSACNSEKSLPRIGIQNYI